MMRLGALVLAAALLAPAVAVADTNDIIISRLSTRVEDDMGNLTNVVGQNREFRSLASQLGVVLAPHMLTPADTIGFGGFQFSVDYATTTIDGDAAYWSAREDANPTDSLGTIGLFARKGMWLPIPSFEVGVGAVHLMDSQIWTAQLYAKMGVHEGYHQLPLPSFSVRGAVSRMMQQRELDLTIASLDLMASKHIGVGGTWRLEPYAGWNLLMIIPRSEVIDPTPNIDPLVPGFESDADLNFVFREQDTIFRHRFALGAKLKYYVFHVTLEAVFALAGSSTDDRPGTNMECPENAMTASCDATDTAAAQRTLSLSAGFDF
jgi:hypothetical protein